MAGSLVIGGSGTLGSAVTRALLEDGAQVAATYFTRPQPLEELKREFPNLHILKCDARSGGFLADTAASAIQLLGSLDSLVFAAGVGADKVFDGSGDKRNFARLENIGDEQLETMLDLHVRAAFNSCRAVIRHMKERRSGRIVILNSLDGVKMLPSPVHFAMSKAALKGLVESLAKEGGEHGITINQINAGPVNGGSSKLLSKKMQSDYLKHCSLERFARPEEISRLASWLCLENTYITGQSIVLDGGL